MKLKIKNILWGIFAAIFATVVTVWLAASPRPDHIVDTNGADNYSLQQITEQDVIELKLGSRGAVSKSELRLDHGSVAVSDGVRYSSDKFTGVYRLYTATLFGGSDIHVILSDFNISEGNFVFYVIFDGEAVGKLEPSDTGLSEFILENVQKTATLEYIIAGESAAFEFVSPVGWE